MRASVASSFLLLAAARHAVAGDAPIVTSNPEDVTYVAKFSGNVKGSVTATSGISGYGVLFMVEIEGLEEKDGPFGYHIHVKPVPDDGNCTATGGHLNPYNVTSPCDKGNLASCEVGDLSGKYGKLEAPKFNASYLDPFASTDPEDKGFFGSRSIVIHRNDSSRLACASFERVELPSKGEKNCTKTSTKTSISTASSSKTTTASSSTTATFTATPADATVTPEAGTTGERTIPSAAKRNGVSLVALVLATAALALAA